MYKGGASYTPQSARIIRYAGLFTPVVLMLYGVLIQFSIVPSSHYVSDVGFFLLCFFWLSISIIQFLIPSKSALDSAMRLVAYHLLSGSYLLFVTGISTPFVACWILLMIAAHTYFSKVGLWCSLLFFICVVVFDIYIWQHDLIAVLRDVVALAAISISGLVTLSISRAQEVDRHELSRSHAQEILQRGRIMTIVNNLADAVLSTDKKGIVRVYNAAALNLLDTNDSLNGHHIDEVLHLTDEEGAKVNLFDAFKQTKSVASRDDLRYTFSDGEELRLEITYSPIRSSYSRSARAEPQDGYIIIMRDITKTKSLEEERDEFISVVSHELRTPITIAEGTISNVQLMMDRPDIKPPVLKDAVNTAHTQVLFLAKMVNDLSTLSRAERGVSDEQEVIDVRELAHKLHEQYEAEATTKNLMFDLDIDTQLGTVLASRLYLEELLQNFITNAIKYTKEGAITLSVHKKGSNVTFAVKDSGIGISKPDQIKIFNKFYRSEDYRTRETGGTGLGLYVATKLARKLKTRIELKSRLNHGSTFSFTLPSHRRTAKEA